MEKLEGVRSADTPVCPSIFGLKMVSPRATIRTCERNHQFPL